MATETKLKVGDKIYRIGNYGITTVITIQRLTPTQAIGESTTGAIFKFKRNTTPGFKDERVACPIGDSTFTSAIYKLENEELKDRILEQRLIEKLKKYDFSRLKLAELKAIEAILPQ